MAIVDGKIRCSGCGESKPLAAFAPSFAKRGRGRCRDCHNIYGAAWMAAAPRAVRARVQQVRRDYYHRTKATKLAQRRAQRKSPEWRGKRRNWELVAAYGITADQYAARLAAQGGRCACCGGLNNSGKRLFVDHDHETGAIRGLLCNRCNAGIGHLGDNIEGVRRALVYLEKHRPTRKRPAVRINLMEVEHVGTA